MWPNLKHGSLDCFAHIVTKDPKAFHKTASIKLVRQFLYLILRKVGQIHSVKQVHGGENCIMTASETSNSVGIPNKCFKLASQGMPLDPVDLELLRS